MEYILQFVDLFLHVDKHLNELVTTFGMWTYVILFLVLFCETGLVVTPLLPGDSLLFATGAIAAIEGSVLNVHVMCIVLIVGAILGDAVNYHIGMRAGPAVFKREDSFFLNKKHLLAAQAFYDRHGGKTIILARFMPIVRTFAPFVAGIGKMGYGRFAWFNVVGALVWVPSFLYAGYYMGNVPSVKDNFHIIIVAIVIISVMPPVVEYIRHKLRGPEKV